MCFYGQGCSVDKCCDTLIVFVLDSWDWQAPFTSKCFLPACDLFLFTLANMKNKLFCLVLTVLNMLLHFSLVVLKLFSIWLIFVFLHQTCLLTVPPERSLAQLQGLYHWPHFFWSLVRVWDLWIAPFLIFVEHSMFSVLPWNYPFAASLHFFFQD